MTVLGRGRVGVTGGAEKREEGGGGGAAKEKSWKPDEERQGERQGQAE